MMSMISQEDMANIINAINNAINDLGYVAVGYENTHMSLNIIIEPNYVSEEQTESSPSLKEELL